MILNTIIKKGYFMKDLFKPVKIEKTVISIRMDSDMLKTVDELSMDADISRNEFIIQCVDYALKNMKK